MVVTKGPAGAPLRIADKMTPAGRLCSSFQAEMTAILEALDWLDGEGGDWRNARVVSDSLSSLTALKRPRLRGADPLVQKANHKLQRLKLPGRKLVFTWTPSHCGLVGNEWADEAAATAAAMDQARVAWPFAIAKAKLKRSLEVRRISHERALAIYGGGEVNYERETFLGRAEARSFWRFRMGHSLELNSYRHRIGMEESAECRRCHEDEETTEHVLLHCPAMAVLRQQAGITSMGDLCRNPRGAVELWLGFKAQPPPTD